jgi:large subunit ribosomal protein L7/L12
MADTNTLVEQLSGLTVLEVADLVKQLETKWGVSAAAPVAVAAVGGAAAGGAAAAPAEEKTAFDVILKEIDAAKKIAVIKEVRAAVPGLGLAEAKALVEGAPKTVKEGVTKEEADQIKTKIEAAGGKVEIK